MRALRVCARAGCAELVTRGYCRDHRPKTSWPRSDRPSGPEWTRLRRKIIRQRPRCAWPGCKLLAEQVDHIVAISKGGAHWDRRNLWGLCKPHHVEKTRREEQWTVEQAQQLQDSVTAGPSDVTATLRELP